MEFADIIVWCVRLYGNNSPVDKRPYRSTDITCLLCTLCIVRYLMLHIGTPVKGAIRIHDAILMSCNDF